MSTKRPRDETDDGGMDVEVQPERRRKLENDTQNKEGESFLPELPKRSSEDTKSTKGFDESVHSMAKVLKEISLEHESLKSNTREMDEIVNLILHKIHAGNLGQARLDLNRVAEGISERFSEKESETRQLREKYATAAFFYEFFMTGRLSMKVIDSKVNFAKESPSYGSFALTAVRMHDDVYISGVISAAHEIRKYAVRRAALKDIVSIGICRDVVKDLLTQLLEFDFRNGPLRRKYDSVKYINRQMEDIVYELSLIGHQLTKNDEKSDELSRVDKSTLIAISNRMKERDARREQVIKQSRDVLKSAKKSIFALHRGNMKQARSEIEKASKCANKIQKEFLEAQPSLRKGSYGNSVEEWAEARLFEYWLLWVSDSEKKRVPFLLHDEIRKEIEMTEDEYLGGLIDLTGEIGRWAVARAAQRDSDNVERALASCRKIQEAVLALGGAAPYRVRKKMSDLERNAEKMQKILYELALVRASGRRTMEVSGGNNNVGSDQKKGGADVETN